MFLLILVLTALRIAVSFEASASSQLSLLHPLHQLCIDRVTNSQLPHFYSAIICGENLSRSDSIVQLFMATGIYHLLVVSGSHLIFMEQMILKWGGYKKLVHLIPLFAYACLCLLNPPVFRSFIQLALSFINQRRHLFWTQEQSIFYCGCLCLLLFPDWFFSFSFALSWAASLSLCFTNKIFAQHCFIYISMLPLLKNASPLVILYNWILSPVFSAILFPISVLTFIVPHLNSLTSQVWDMFFMILQRLPHSVVSQELNIPPLHFIWLYIGGLHFILQLYALYFSRRESLLKEFGRAH